MNQKLLDAFKTLELSPESSREEVRLAYRDLIQVWHPDKHYSNDRLREKASEKLKEINRAYDFLREYYKGDADHADNGTNRPKQDGNPEDQYILQACLKPECSALNRVPRGKNPQQAKCGKCGRPLERAAYEEFEYRNHSEKQDLLDRETKARVRQAEELRKLIQQKERERRERDKRVAQELLEQQNRAAREKQKQEACEQAANKEEIRRLVVEELHKNEIRNRVQAVRRQKIHGRMLKATRTLAVPAVLLVCLVGNLTEEVPRNSDVEIAPHVDKSGSRANVASGKKERLQKRKAATEKNSGRLEGFNFRDDVVVDERTGLMWARNAGLAKEKMDWDQARQWLRSLEIGGYRNWRLPTRNELEELFRRGGKNPAEYYNGLGFTSVQPSWYWASNKGVFDNGSAWVVSMGYGYVSKCNKGDCNQVWPVREQ